MVLVGVMIIIGLVEIAVSNEYLILLSVDFKRHHLFLFTVVIFNLTSPSQLSSNCLPVSKLNLPSHKQDNNNLPRYCLG
jgi:hypothetical protein